MSRWDLAIASRASHEPDPAAFRAEFPVFERVRYLNAGSDGPVPRRAAEAAQAQIQADLERGRPRDARREGVIELIEALRARYADLIGCGPQEVALTGAATDGVNTVLNGLRLNEGDEIVTSDEEHPGLLAPLAAVRDRHGVRIRVVPFEEVAAAVTGRTRLAACSHVSWKTGKVIDAGALRETGVPFLLDGAQGLGAVPVDVRTLGCDYYAAPGQKWLCGPSRSGCLFVRESRTADVSPPAWPNFVSLADPGRPLDLALWSGAQRLDLGDTPVSNARWSLAALDVLAEPGFPWIFERGARLAARLAERLADSGVEVVPRGPSTLVVFEVPDGPTALQRFDAAGVVMRDIPGRPWVRASIGAWCEDEDLERVVELAVANQAR